MCYRELIDSALADSPVLQHHFFDRSDAAHQAVPDVQEPVPFELPVQVVQLFSFLQLSHVPQLVLTWSTVAIVVMDNPSRKASSWIAAVVRPAAQSGDGFGKCSSGNRSGRVGHALHLACLGNPPSSWQHSAGAELVDPSRAVAALRKDTATRCHLSEAVACSVSLSLATAW